MQAIKNSI